MPDLKEFFSLLEENSKVTVCHQPYFFNPGVSLKFLFLENLHILNKKIIFLDTNKVKIEVDIPFPSSEGIKKLEFINTNLVLENFPTPALSKIYTFFSVIEVEMRRVFSENSEIFSNFLYF